MKKITIVLLSALILSGCNKKTKFNCESDLVVNSVISMQQKIYNEVASTPVIKYILEEIVKSLKFWGTEGLVIDHNYQNVSLRLENIRTIARDEELGNYECKATMYSKKDNERTNGFEIIYTAEATNAGKDSYIQTAPLTPEQIGHLAAVLVTQGKSIPTTTAEDETTQETINDRIDESASIIATEEHIAGETIRGIIYYGSLDSSIGDFSFLTQSDVGYAIFDKCDVASECEVQALIEETDFGYMIKKVFKAKRID
ncbi:hypothetical protein OURE66S_03299 [Oligella ureolytica]